MGGHDIHHMINELASSLHPVVRLNSLDRVGVPLRSKSGVDALAARTNPWSGLSKKFKELQFEENRLVQQRTASEWLYGHFSYRESGESSSWWVEGETTENIRAEFELLATEGGIALDSVAGTPPQEHWLHNLVCDLRADGSKHLRLFSDRGGIVERLCEASAIYCMRLDRRWLEKTRMPIAPPELRRGYRPEVRQWMAVEGVITVKAAAKRLALSLSALKSIMCNRGICRYGDATLSRVLGRIGYNGGEIDCSPLSPPALFGAASTDSKGAGIFRIISPLAHRAHPAE